MIPVEELSREEIQGLYYYYCGWFFLLLVVLFIFRQISKSNSSSNKSLDAPNQTVVTIEFKRFQRLYVLVYLIMMAADWLQGPYVYALYSHYKYSEGDIATLFIVGFGSSLIFGTIVGSAADKYGRKFLCIVFGITYGLSCMTKHINNFNVLLIGRLLGGIATSILFSSFESWMVSEHHNNNYNEEWLGITFSVCTSGNGIVAIVSGVVASIVRDKFGPVAPFDVSLICLTVGTIIIMLYWSENTGDSNINLSVTLNNAFQRLREDKKIMLLGIIQSFFEGAMYIFVFKWTPALESTNNGLPIYHGWIFASFMICTLIGSSIFSHLLTSGQRVERVAFFMFIVASFSLLVPVFTSSHTITLLSFFVFEVCVGLFWPSLGFLRSRYVPEEVRATTMNIFRIPLNMIVVSVLFNIERFSASTPFIVCFFTLSIALACLYHFNKIVLDSPEAAKKSQESVPLTNISSH